MLSGSSTSSSSAMIASALRQSMASINPQRTSSAAVLGGARAYNSAFQSSTVSSKYVAKPGANVSFPHHRGFICKGSPWERETRDNDELEKEKKGGAKERLAENGIEDPAQNGQHRRCFNQRPSPNPSFVCELAQMQIRKTGGVLSYVGTKGCQTNRRSAGSSIQLDVDEGVRKPTKKSKERRLVDTCDVGFERPEGRPFFSIDAVSCGKMIVRVSLRSGSYLILKQKMIR